LCKNTTTDEVIDHIKRIFGLNCESCEHVIGKSSFGAFKIGIDYNLLNEIMNGDHWPEGAIINRFRFKRNFSAQNSPNNISECDIKDKSL
jgi:hypothetical protein